MRMDCKVAVWLAAAWLASLAAAQAFAQDVTTEIGPGASPLDWRISQSPDPEAASVCLAPCGPVQDASAGFSCTDAGPGESVVVSMVAQYADGPRCLQALALRADGTPIAPGMNRGQIVPALVGARIEGVNRAPEGSP